MCGRWYNVTCLGEITLIDAYNRIFACACYFDIACACYIRICTGGALWWAIYRILIGHPSDTYDWLLIYITLPWMHMHMDIYYNNLYK